MLKKLTETQQEELLNQAILEFAEKGYSGAGLSSIAKSAGVSVGVIYKYYKDKDELFDACVSKSISYLDEVLTGAAQEGDDLPKMIRSLVRQVRTCCREHPEYFRMYHQITLGDEPERTRQLAERIERPSAKAYKAALREARDAGRIDPELDAGAGAFFFDNLMMMFHFSCSCAYYRERMNLYCGKRIAASEKKMEDQMVRFMLNGLGYKE